MLRAGCTNADELILLLTSDQAMAPPTVGRSHWLTGAVAMV